MANKTQQKKVKLTKKIVKKQIVKRLENSLGDLQNFLGTKKFNRRIKKASKLLTIGLPKTSKLKSKEIDKIILTDQIESNLFSINEKDSKTNAINEQL